MWGSDDVIDKFYKFKQSASLNEETGILVSIEDVWWSIRKDLGHIDKDTEYCQHIIVRTQPKWNIILYFPQKNYFFAVFSLLCLELIKNSKNRLTQYEFFQVSSGVSLN